MINLVSDKPHYENVPFEIPESWEWCRLDELCSIKGGKRIPKGKNFSILPTKHIYIRVTDMKKNTILDNELHYIDEEVFTEICKYTISKDDLYLTIAGTIGAVGEVPKLFDGMNLTENAAKLTHIQCNKKYLMYALLSTSSQEHFKSRYHQVAQPKLSIETAASTPITFPPLAEQQRIVAEVEKWFALIDELEANKEDLRDYIKQVKSKVLELAIHGKLVPQDPNDEPAIELLKRINPNFKPCDTSHYENLPAGWSVCGIKDIAKTIASRKYQILQSEIYNEGAYPVVSQSANYIEGYSNLKDKVLEHKQPVIVFGDHTRVAKYIAFDFIVGADGVKILLPNINSKYFYYLILKASENIKNRGYGRHFGLLSKEEYLIPPLNEQHRIVSLLETVELQLDTINAEL